MIRNSAVAPPPIVETPLDTTVAIEAPEQIRFHYRLAGPAQRVSAHVVDILIMAAIGVLFMLLLMLVFAPAAAFVSSFDAANKAAMGFVLAGAFALQWGYFALFEGFNAGQTPGKRLFSLRVVKAGGEPIGFVDGMLRNLIRTADLLPFGYAAGLLSMLIDPRFRRLGDLVAGTMVVVEDRLSVGAALAIQPPSTHELSLLPSRVTLDAEEQRTIEMFLRRASFLGVALSAELAAVIAPALGAKYGVRVDDPVRLLALLYLRATGPAVARKSEQAGRVTEGRAAA